MCELKIFVGVLTDELLKKFITFPKASLFYPFKELTGMKCKDWCLEKLQGLETPKCAWCGKIVKFNTEYCIEERNLFVIVKFIEEHICFDSKNCPRKGLNPNSVEFVSKAYNISEEEANRRILERNKSPFYRTNYASDEEYRNAQKRNEQWYINQYEDGKERFIKRNNTISEKVSKEGMIKAHGKEKAEAICKSKATCCKEHFEKKFGDSWKEEYEKHLQKVLQTEESFIERYGPELGKIKWKDHIKLVKQILKKRLDNETPEQRRRRCCFSKEFFKIRYGDSWKPYYKEFQMKLQVKAGKASKLSLKYFKPIIDFLDKNHLKYYVGVDGNKEYFLWDKEAKKLRLYDLCILDIKTIIEFHGSLYHYNKDNLVENPFGFSLNERKEKDDQKERLAKANGFDYFVIFDTDDRIEMAEKLIKIIQEKINARTN